jgi:hypothetical protein
MIIVTIAITVVPRIISILLAPRDDNRSSFPCISLLIIGSFLVPRKLNNPAQPIINKTTPTQKIPAQYSPENPKMLVDRKKTLRMPKEIENITIRPRKTRSTRWSIVASHLPLLTSIQKIPLEINRRTIEP